jgi:hypothetical protein
VTDCGCRVEYRGPDPSSLFPRGGTRARAIEKAGRSLGLVYLEGCVIVRCPLHDAAPDVLEALEALMAAVPERQGWRVEERARARAAIAKALGEAPV